MNPETPTKAQVKFLLKYGATVPPTRAACADAINAIITAGRDRVLRCAFCGRPYPEGTPDHKHESLAAHIRVCEAHPIGKENRELRAALTKLREVVGAYRATVVWDEQTSYEECELAARNLDVALNPPKIDPTAPAP